MSYRLGTVKVQPMLLEGWTLFFAGIDPGERRRTGVSHHCGQEGCIPAPSDHSKGPEYCVKQQYTVPKVFGFVVMGAGR